MNFINQLINQKYLIYNVNDKKMPCDKNGNGFAWSNITLEELEDMRNYDSEMWGMRTGIQPNGKYIIGLDFDLWFKDRGNYIKCDKTRELYNIFEVINPNLDGCFCSSTMDNKGVFCDISNCKNLVDLLGKINKAKFECDGYHLEIMNGSNWVLPPSQTICKIKKEKHIKRSFYNENCILEIEPDTNIYKFIYNYVEDYLNSISKSVPSKNLRTKQAKETYLEFNKTNKDDNKFFCEDVDYMKDFIDLLSKDRAENYNQWWKIGFALKQQFGDDGLEMFKYFSSKGSNYDEKGLMKNWNNNLKPENYKYDGLTKNYIINCAKEDNPDGFLDALLGYKLYLQKKYDELEKEKYKKDKEKLEQNISKILEPPVWVKKHRVHKNWEYCSWGDIQHCYESVLGKEFMNKYSNDDDKKHYDTLTFNPDPNFKTEDKENLTHFNLYQPLKIKDYKPKINKSKEAKEFVDNHLLHLSDFDDKAFEFLLQWMAWVIHLPHKKTKVVPILLGIEGNGKTSLYKIMEALLGPKYCTDTSRADKSIFGRFNDDLENRLLICINEANYETFNKYMDDFKSLITEDKYKQETKGKPIITIDNYINFIVTTNNERLFSVVAGNRRFYFIKTGSKLKNNVEYFNQFYDNLEDPIMIYYIYEYLKTVINPTFKFELAIRDNTTAFHKLLMQTSINPFYTFLQNYIELAATTIYDPQIEREPFPLKLRPEDLITKYNNYCVSNNLSNHENSKSIKMKLLQIDENCYRVYKVGQKTHKGYILNSKIIIDYLKDNNLLSL